MQNINELIGIINGINYDGIINEKEIQFLRKWVNENRNYSTNHKQENLIYYIDKALEDFILTEEESEKILLLAEDIISEKEDESSIFNELNGIIEGIISDDEVNDFEIKKLQKWFDINKRVLSNNLKNKQLKNAIYQVLEDGIVDAEEQSYILKLLKEKIEETKLEIKINHLKTLIQQRKNIGIELIDLLDKTNNIDYIHRQAEEQLKKSLNSYSGFYVQDPEIIIVSLSLIAMLNYDGGFYDSVEEVYGNLYFNYGKQKVEGLIRDILTRYRTTEDKTHRSRLINVPLKHAIVPSYYLANFFDFIYDIYKLNFEYDLSGDLYSEFSFVYEGLISNLNSTGDSLELNVTHKTYRLIQTTKDLVIQDKNLDSIIKLSIMIINIIDKHIWGKDLKITNSYLKNGYDLWAESIQKSNEKKTRTISNFRSYWEPKYHLRDDKILLLPPFHKIKSCYNYKEINVIVKNEDEIIYINTQPPIKEIFGGYQIEISSIKIDKPLGKIRYLLITKNEIIYDSKESLYRKFIIFDQKGNEIKNNTDYKGEAIFCTKENLDKTNLYYTSKYYNLSMSNVKYGDNYIIEGVLFNFTSLTKPGVFGEKYDNNYIYSFEDEKELPVLKEVKYLVFEDTAINPNYEIMINDRIYKLNNFKNTVTQKEGITKYVVDLEINKPDIYSISVRNKNAQKSSKIASFDFAYDPVLEFNSIKKNEDIYIISLKTGLIDNVITEEIKVRYFDIDVMKFLNKSKEYSYRVNFDFELYQISNENWFDLERDLWINDLKQDTVLKVYGIEADSVQLLSSTGVCLYENLSLKNKGLIKNLPIGFLTTYKSIYDYVNIFFLKEGRAVNVIRCYNKCVIEKKGIQIAFDPIKSDIAISLRYKGNGLVFIEIFDEENNKIYQSDIILNGGTVIVHNLVSFKKYKINICEKKKGLLKIGTSILQSIERTFFSRKDFVGKSFRINEVFFNQMINKQFVEKSYFLRKTYVKFEKQIDESTFIGQIYVKGYSHNFYLYKINPVEIEVCSDVIDDYMELYITNNGDGLLIDFNHCGILNSLDDDTAIDIFLYSVEVEGEK